MKLQRLINSEETTHERRKRQRNDISDYLQQIKKVKDEHLTWKEERRKRTLEFKYSKGKITKEEEVEYNDLNTVEVITEGYCIKPIIRKRSRNYEESCQQRKIQTRSTTRRMREELEKGKQMYIDELLTKHMSK